VDLGFAGTYKGDDSVPDIQFRVFEHATQQDHPHSIQNGIHVKPKVERVYQLTMVERMLMKGAQHEECDHAQV
jgi:hypothetical protein